MRGEAMSAGPSEVSVALARAAFGEKVLTMPPRQAHPVPRGTASLPDSAGRPLEGEIANPIYPKTLASEAGDKIKKARFDPYAFSPPKAPGMDLG